MENVTSALTTVSTSLTEVINIGNIAAVLGTVLAAAIVLYFGWFGIRKLISVVTNAAKGRLKV